jgi:hypothetical protein
MDIFVSGRIGELIALIILIIISAVALMKSLRGKLPTIRRLPGIDALEEVVGRAAETGRPVFYTTGFGGGTIRGASSYPTLAGMDIMAHAVRLCARLGADFVSTYAMPEAVPIARALVLESLKAENKAELWKEDLVRFVSPLQWAYTMGSIATISRENAGGVILIGPWWGEALIFSEESHSVGAMSIAGSSSFDQLPYFVGVCDYTLIGEEIFAAGAYLSKDAVTLGTIEGEDWSRILVIILLILGLFATSTFTYILKM